MSLRQTGHLSGNIEPTVGLMQGEHAHRVWSAIYDQSCFSNLNDTETCQEQRVFYRLISGECHMLGCCDVACVVYQVPRLLLSCSCPPAESPDSSAVAVVLVVKNCTKCCLPAGMHASISAHLSNEYLLNEETDSWGQNLEEFTRRLGNTAVKERVENMYFTYLFVLRAVLKAGPLLESVDYSTGCQDQDEHTKKLMQQLVSMRKPLFK